MFSFLCAWLFCSLFIHFRSFTHSFQIHISHDIMADPDMINAKCYNPGHSNLEVAYHPQRQGQPSSFGNFPSYATSGLEGGADAYPQQPQDTKLLGLSVPVFWTVVIGLVMLLAGAIGGGIGGGLAASQHSSQSKASPPSSLSISGSSISSTTTTATIASPPSQSESASPLLTTTTSPTTTTGTQLTAFGPSPAPSDNCPSVNNTQYTPLDASGNSMTVAINPGGLTKVQSFVRICNRNYPAGAPHGNPDTLDIMKLYLPTLEACIDACATYNIVYQENRPQRPGGAQDGTDMGLCRSVAIVKNGEWQQYQVFRWRFASLEIDTTSCVHRLTLCWHYPACAINPPQSALGR
ncbi:hypothetical protein NEUTE2DRAFT_158494 [Neurospora tetrasperma FGSC 2509]|nr:hypothetical protein NEUTE2DRAFT_158494 [Neurospora tetrasperma FGSC 2509]